MSPSYSLGAFAFPWQRCHVYSSVVLCPVLLMDSIHVCSSLADLGFPNTWLYFCDSVQLKELQLGQAWWHTSLIPALGRQAETGRFLTNKKTPVRLLIPSSLASYENKVYKRILCHCVHGYWDKNWDNATYRGYFSSVLVWGPRYWGSHSGRRRRWLVTSRPVRKEKKRKSASLASSFSHTLVL